MVVNWINCYGLKKINVTRSYSWHVYNDFEDIERHWCDPWHFSAGLLFMDEVCSARKPLRLGRWSLNTLEMSFGRSSLTNERNSMMERWVLGNKAAHSFTFWKNLIYKLFFSALKGDRLLHVSHWWLWGGRCHGARQRRPLHQPLMWAELLFTSHHCGWPEAHRHLCLPPHFLWRGTHVRLQVPNWGCQQQAALQLRHKEVSQVPQLMPVFKRLKEDL